MHVWPVRVYYEDTDLAGIVYYANYLRFIERARTEWIRTLGIDQTLLKSQSGIVFAVRSLSADYFAPARFDDQLDVTTAPVRLTAARIVLGQQVLRGTQCLFASQVTLACLGADMRPARLPQALRGLMGTSLMGN